MCKWSPLQALRFWHGFSALFQFGIFVCYSLKLGGVLPNFVGDSNKTKIIAWASSTWECEDQGQNLTDWRICPTMPSKWDTWEFSYIALPLLMVGTFATFINHFFLCLKTGGLCSPFEVPELEDYLHGGVKYEYWIEYSISAPPITAVVYYFSGVVEARTLLIVLVAQCYLMAIGLGLDLMRRYISTGDRLFSDPVVYSIMYFLYVVGWLNFAAIWIPLFSTMMHNWNELNDNMVGVLILIFIEFFMFAGFGIVQWYCTSRIFEINGKKVFTRLFFSPVKWVVAKPSALICYYSNKSNNSNAKVVPMPMTTGNRPAYSKIIADYENNDQQSESKLLLLSLYKSEHFWHLFLSFSSKASLALLYLVFI